MEFRRKRRGEARLDITPIVDTVFNLLIFFALSLNFIVTPGIKVKLPGSSSEEVVRQKREVTLAVTEAGEIFLARKRVALEELPARLTDIARANPQTLIIIQADKNVRHGTVVQIMDKVRRSGLSRLAIATQLKPEP